MRQRLQWQAIGHQPLDPEREAVVDRMAAGLADDAVVVERDNGLWRPVLAWALAALFVAGYFRQLAAGPFTGQRVYDLGAFATGPGLVEIWRLRWLLDQRVDQRVDRPGGLIE